MFKKINFLIISIGFFTHYSTIHVAAVPHAMPLVEFQGDMDPINHLHHFESISYSTALPQVLHGISQLIIASSVRSGVNNEKLVAVALALHRLGNYITDPNLALQDAQPLLNGIQEQTRRTIQALTRRPQRAIIQ